MSKHTPGEWAARSVLITDRNGMTIEFYYDSGDPVFHVSSATTGDTIGVLLNAVALRTLHDEIGTCLAEKFGWES